MDFKRKGILLTLLTAGFLVLTHCRTSEAPVTMIEGDPQTAKEDTSVTAGDDSSSFMKLVVGERHPIKSMDPLYASNPSTRRFIQQIYEGLIRYNANGELEPAIAANWTIADDSLTYRFHLRKNVYFHDSDIFAAGTGQRVTSGDFKYVFERMARMQVPPEAGRLFMSIEGFEPYYREQRRLYNPDDRKLSGISGIEAPNDTTLVLRLTRKDPFLLQKLATPYAVVYPRQAVLSSEGYQRITHAVGSGPFQFSQQKSDSLYILSRFDGYWENRNESTRTPRLNRVDFVHRTEETLQSRFSGGTIDLLPELGPESMRTLVDSTGQLKQEITDPRPVLYDGGQITYNLLYNKSSNADRATILREINALNLPQLASGIHPAGVTVSFQHSPPAPDSPTALAEPLDIPFTDDLFVREMFQQMQPAFKKNGIDFRMNNLRVPLSNTALTVERHLPLYRDHGNEPDSLSLVTFNVKHWGLSRPTVENYQLNRYPWWMNLRDVRIKTPTENL